MALVDLQRGDELALRQASSAALEALYEAALTGGARDDDGDGGGVVNTGRDTLYGLVAAHVIPVLCGLLAVGSMSVR